MEIPDPMITAFKAARADIRRSRDAENYRPVDTPMEGDVVLLRANGYPLHIGYCVNDRHMLHVENNGLGSVVDPLNSMRWRSRNMGFYRYEPV